MPPRAPRASMDNLPKKRAPRQLPTGDIPPDDLSAIFARNLKVARLQHAMTLEDVAAAAGMTHSGVSNVERGRKAFTLKTMQKLASVFGLEVGDMLKLPAAEPAAGDNPVPRLSRNKTKL